MSGSWLTFKKVAVSRLSDLAICRSLYIYNLHHSKLLNWGWIFSFLFWVFFPPHPSQAVYFIINNKLWCHGVFIHLSILIYIVWNARRLYSGVIPGELSGSQCAVNFLFDFFLNEILGRICLLIAYRVLALTYVLGPRDLVTFRYRGRGSMYFLIYAIICHIYNVVNCPHWNQILILSTILSKFVTFL